MATPRRSPSIALSLSVLCVLLLLPFVGVSVDHWQAASARVESAEQVVRAADRIDALLRLPSAIDDEIFAGGYERGREELLSQLPEAARPFVTLDAVVTSEDASARVDELVASLDDPDLADLVDEARTVLANGVGSDVENLRRAFGPISTWVTDAIEREVVAMNAGASGTGDRSIAHLARLGEATADLQLTLSGMEWRWTTIVAGDFFPSTIDDRMLFTHSLIAFETQAVLLEQSLPSAGPIRDRWLDLDRSPSLAGLLDQYRSTAEAMTAGDLELPEPGATIDLATVDFVAATQLGSTITDTIERSDAVSADVDALLDAVVGALRTEAALAVARAQEERSTTLGWLGLSAALFGLATVGVAALIGRPVRRMADAAARLSEGDLDVRVPERGPKELLVGSRALNQALQSLKTAEKQANALAEERLDDPVLDERAPGHLGASLQTAVERLTGALTDRERIQVELEYEATHDGLTKLANRRAVLDHLGMATARAERAGHLAALLFIDLDDFKLINDAHGHHAGDVVLTEIADRLERAKRSGDLAGRLGGDEFVLVAEPVAHAEEAMRLAERIQREVTQPLLVDGTTVVPRVSIGVGLSDASLSPDEIMRDADLAVFRAKSEGGGLLYLCDEDLRAEVRHRAAMEDEIRRGIARDEFELFFQPGIRSSDQSMVSVEGLIRWRHPERGLVGPGGFIPIAEMSDLIVELDNWVLAAAGRQLAAWRDDPLLGHVKIAVNISAQHFNGPGLAVDVRSVVDAYDFDPALLVIEVTETALLSDIDVAAKELAAIQALGSRIALDDFGTGFMSISHLRSLPVDVVKIDASFTMDLANPETRSLMELIIETGHVLGISVTVEGVETAEDVAVSREIGADTFQGYHFGRPVPASELLATVSRAPAR